MNSFIPEGIEFIENYAFQNCKGLTSIYIPKTVNYVTGLAFYGCEGLKTIIVDDDNPKYKSPNGCNAIL